MSTDGPRASLGVLFFPGAEASKRAADYVRAWPDRPELGPEAEAARQQLVSMVEERLRYEELRRDGLSYMEFLEAQLQASGSAEQAGELLLMQVSGGRRQEALQTAQLLAQGLENGEVSDPSQWHLLASTFTDLYQQAFSNWLRNLQSAPMSGEPIRIRSSLREAEFSAEEAAILNVLGRLTGMPVTALASYQRCPAAFQAKVERLGGLDAALKARRAPARGPDRPATPPGPSLYLEGEARANPAALKRKLKVQHPDSESADQLLHLIRTSCKWDSAWTEIALRHARDLVRRSEAPLRLRHYGMLVDVVDYCQGELGSDLRQEIIELIDESQGPESSVDPSEVRKLETHLLRAWSHWDPGGVIRYLELVHDPGARFNLYSALAAIRLEEAVRSARFLFPRW